MPCLPLLLHVPIGVGCRVHPLVHQQFTKRRGARGCRAFLTSPATWNGPRRQTSRALSLCQTRVYTMWKSILPSARPATCTSSSTRPDPADADRGVCRRVGSFRSADGGRGGACGAARSHNSYIRYLDRPARQLCRLCVCHGVCRVDRGRVSSSRFCFMLYVIYVTHPLRLYSSCTAVSLHMQRHVSVAVRCSTVKSVLRTVLYTAQYTQSQTAS